MHPAPTKLRLVTVASVAVGASALLASVAMAAPSGSVPDAEATASGPVGPGCESIDTGAVAEMTAAEAVAAIPDIATFNAALGASGLVEQLVGVGPFTIFAPSNAAMDAIPQNVFDSLLADADLLRAVVGNHVVVGLSLAPESLVEAREVNTLTGHVAVHQAADAAGIFRIGESQLVCGNIITADATIYIIDGVLQPTIENPCAPGSSVPGSSVPGDSMPLAASSVPGSIPGSSVPC